MVFCLVWPGEFALFYSSAFTLGFDEDGVTGIGGMVAGITLELIAPNNPLLGFSVLALEELFAYGVLFAAVVAVDAKVAGIDATEVVDGVLIDPLI